MKNPQKTNRAGIELIKQYEGFRARKYRDAVGLWTIGYGHLLKRGETLSVISQKEAEKLLAQDLHHAEMALARYVSVKLTPNQRAALVSWIFNLGAGAFRASTLCKRVNERAFHKVPGEMMRWVLAGGKPLKGLIRRRAAEAELFIT